MAGAGERGAEGRTDPADSDHTDVESSGSLGCVVRPPVSIREMHLENLSGLRPGPRSDPKAWTVDGPCSRRTGCPPEPVSGSSRPSTPGDCSRGSTVHTPVPGCPHVINRDVHRRWKRVRKPVVGQRIQPPSHRASICRRSAGKTFRQPLARLLATRIEISHAAGSGVRKPRATEVETLQERRRTARRPTGHGGRGNPVAVADDDAATRTDRAGAIAARRVRKPACRWKSRSRTSCRVAREGVKTGARRVWS